MNAIKTIFITGLLALVMITSAPAMTMPADDHSVLPSLNAAVYKHKKGILVNLVNFGSEEVQMTLKDESGNVVLQKTLKTGAFSSRLFKSRKMKNGAYLAEFRSAGQTITRTVKA